MLFFTFSRSKRYKRQLNAFDCVWSLMVKSVIHTCHNKLHSTLFFGDRVSPYLTSKLGVVSRVDVLDYQSSSSFNFNSSFVRWINRRMFLHTTTAIHKQSGKYIFYQYTIDNVLNPIMWIIVVPHQVGITTIFKVAWIRRFLGETHIHTS